MMPKVKSTMERIVCSMTADTPAEAFNGVVNMTLARSQDLLNKHGGYVLVSESHHILHIPDTNQYFASHIVTVLVNGLVE